MKNIGMVSVSQESESSSVQLFPYSGYISSHTLVSTLPGSKIDAKATSLIPHSILMRLITYSYGRALSE